MASLIDNSTAPPNFPEQPFPWGNQPDKLQPRQSAFVQTKPLSGISEIHILLHEINTLKDKITRLEKEVTELKVQNINFIKINMLITKRLHHPLDAVVEPDDDGFIARTTDIPMFGFGDDPLEAVNALKSEIESLYNDLMEDDDYSEEWLEIKKLLIDHIGN